MIEEIVPHILEKEQAANSINVPREPDQEQKKAISEELEQPKKKPVKASEERKAEFDKKANAKKSQAASKSEDKIVERLNKKHAAVHTSEFHILTEKPHPFIKGAMDFTLESKQSFMNTYENDVITSDDGKTEKTVAQIWLKSPDRRAFLDGIIFDPSTDGHKQTAYNIWRGFAVKPKKGCCELYKAHIKDVICAKNTYYYNYVWKWLAHLIQHPDKIATGLVLMGSQGTGKGVFVKAMGTLFGQHFVHLDNLDRLLGNFNFHLKNAVLVFGDEAIWGGNKKDIGKLKGMVTEEWAMIEQKGKDSIAVRNFRHFIFASNEDRPIHLDRDDRRFLILQISEEKKENYAYFKAIEDELKNGGYEALLYELQHENISGFNPRALPHNAEAFKIKIQEAPTIDQYIYQALNEGSFDIGNPAHCGTWKEAVPTDSLYIDYRCWCDKQRIPTVNDVQIGTALKKLIPSMQKTRPRVDGGRENQYEFPTLPKAREEFQIAYKVGDEVWK